MTTTGKRITPRERHVAAMSAGERLRETMAPARERRDETLGRARERETETPAPAHPRHHRKPPRAAGATSARTRTRPRAASTLTTGRARRVLKVGTLTTSLGGSYIWQALKRPFQSQERTDRDLLAAHVRNAIRIVERSTELKGAFMKLAQMLSMRSDLLPPEALEVLATVQSSVPPMSYDVIRAQVTRELGAPPEEMFERFEPEAFAAASLGQVHRAVLPAGDEVVVKIQYPGVEATVVQDLRNVRALLQTLSRIGRDVMRQKIDASEVYAELEERLREELDYVKEAANLGAFRRRFADDPELEIPEPYPAFSSRRVLTMSALDGYPLQEILAPGVDQELKDWVAIKYFRVLWRQIFEFGMLHTDPHPGNYLVTHHPRLCMLDFGSVRVFSEPIRAAYLALARGLLDDDEAATADAFVGLGFLDRDDDPAPMLRIMRIIFEPVLVDRRWDPREYRSVDRAMEVASIGFEHRIFKSPGHRVFLGRALLGLESYVQQLGTVANWHRLFHESVERAPAACD
ncbi:MAG: AarF/ABC1/UbiB kinase family protein [Deltaproteobacteria bacterium]|nr:MAG: AarF/ABC1/UbiB kinase family protein [Deltaproteobacteria bacterium]